MIVDWAFAHMQRPDDAAPDEADLTRDAAGGAVYLRLSTRPLEQARGARDAAFRRRVIDGGYWLRRPGPNAQVVIAYQGAVAPAAIEAAGRIGNDRRDIGVFALTSADRLHAGWTSARRARLRGRHVSPSTAEDASRPRNWSLKTRFASPLSVGVPL